MVELVTSELSDDFLLGPDNTDDDLRLETVLRVLNDGCADEEWGKSVSDEFPSMTGRFHALVADNWYQEDGQGFRDVTYLGERHNPDGTLSSEWKAYLNVKNYETVGEAIHYGDLSGNVTEVNMDYPGDYGVKLVDMSQVDFLAEVKDLCEPEGDTPQIYFL